MSGHQPQATEPPSRRGASRSVADPVWEVVESLVAEQEQRLGGRPLVVVDVGGGSGVHAVRIAARGHRVTVVDPSPNALATLTRRAEDARVTDRIVALQGDAAGLAELVPARGADLVLCHGVLDVVDDPADAMTQVAALVAADAPVSVVVAGRRGAVFGRVLAGHLQEAAAILRSEEGSYGGSDPLPRRFTPETVTTLVERAGLAVRAIRGVRTFADFAGAGGDDRPDIAELDAIVADDPAYHALAATLHVVAAGHRDGT